MCFTFTVEFNLLGVVQVGPEDKKKWSCTQFSGWSRVHLLLGGRADDLLIHSPSSLPTRTGSGGQMLVSVWYKPPYSECELQIIIDMDMSSIWASACLFVVLFLGLV